ncbi:MAG: Gfo/Idh/MocA family oxidoreductase [Rhodospirillaceae bacterium]|nr:Gfo/Idh/MocA family oxidoreductase [Rhodospirillaceae bacterium]
MVKVGVIGLGYWGPNLVRVFGGDARAAVVGAADPLADRRALITSRFPAIATFSSGEDLIDADVDAVVVATPLASHYDLALRALRAGKHVLVEKPFTATALQAEMLVSEAARRGLVIMVDHTFVYNPAVVRLKEMIKSDHLGELLYFDSRRINLGLFRPDSDVIWDLAVHDFSILDYLVGGMPLAVSAVGVAHINGQRNNTAFITLQYTNQFVAHIDVNWLSPVKVRQLLVGGGRRMVIYDDLAPDSRLRVYDCGVDGLAADDADYRKRVEYRFGDMWAPYVPSTEPLTELAAHFLDCIEKKDTPRSGGEAGLRIARILEAATQSLRRGGIPVSFAAAG